MSEFRAASRKFIAVLAGACTVILCTVGFFAWKGVMTLVSEQATEDNVKELKSWVEKEFAELRLELREVKDTAAKK